VPCRQFKNIFLNNFEVIIFWSNVMTEQSFAIFVRTLFQKLGPTPETSTPFAVIALLDDVLTYLDEGGDKNKSLQKAIELLNVKGEAYNLEGHKMLDRLRNSDLSAAQNIIAQLQDEKTKLQEELAQDKEEIRAEVHQTELFMKQTELSIKIDGNSNLVSDFRKEIGIAVQTIIESNTTNTGHLIKVLNDQTAAAKERKETLDGVRSLLGSIKDMLAEQNINSKGREQLVKGVSTVLGHIQDMLVEQNINSKGREELTKGVRTLLDNITEMLAEQNVNSRDRKTLLQQVEGVVKATRAIAIEGGKSALEARNFAIGGLVLSAIGIGVGTWFAYYPPQPQEVPKPADKTEQSTRATQPVAQEITTPSAPLSEKKIRFFRPPRSSHPKILQNPRDL
jgi:hypothetical protein